MSVPASLPLITVPRMGSESMHLDVGGGGSGPRAEAWPSCMARMEHCIPLLYTATWYHTSVHDAGGEARII
jgi:hypothetical protein